MRDITHKRESLRIATATALLTTEEPVERLLAKARDDKGDALEIARVAGVLAAQRTWETIPYCHQIPVTHARVTYAQTETTIRVEMRCVTIAPTGCEVEAMTGAATAALTLYDILKPHTDALRIDDIRLLEKSGGKSDHQVALVPAARVAVITTSDAVCAGEREDRAGNAVRTRLADIPDVTCLEPVRASQAPNAVASAVREAVAAGAEIVLTVGGTGVGHHDRTPEVVRGMVDRALPGIVDAMRHHGLRRTSLAMLSDAAAGVIARSLVVTLPGSLAGATQAMDALFPALLKAVANLRRDPPPTGTEHE